MEVPGPPLSRKVVGKIILLVRPLAHLRHIMVLADVSHDRNPPLPILSPCIAGLKTCVTSPRRCRQQTIFATLFTTSLPQITTR
jgi:hypothetical protein